jgi:type I restriction enzyme S subunit
MNDFKSKINEVRDILRKDGITGMDSINHCVAFTILRNLNENICERLNVHKKYTFELFNKDDEGKLLDKDKLFEKFYKTIGDRDCFVNILINKFKFKAFKFLIKTSLYLERIFNCFANINIEELNLDFDVIGVIYEIHLSTGATGSGMRDLGQYFTNRKVIEFMVKLCNPKVKANGEIETVLDPSMGTGGFLTMATKYLNENNENIDWEINQKNIYGFDISENLQSLAHINLLIENNQLFKNIVVEDTLHNDYKINNVLIDKVDIILANEPFGLKNIIYKECCERIKQLKINGTKAEPLFVQLMMQSLEVNGRCAVVVPDGVLFNDAKLHKETRKYLIKNLNLKKVISLDGDMFLNTGVKSSILYFVNDGSTSEVEFSKIKFVNSEIQEDSIKKVKTNEIIEKDYSLFLNKYIQEQTQIIEGIEYKTIGEICEFLSKSKRPASFGVDNGLFPFYTSSMTNKFCDVADFNEELIIIGDGGCANINIDNKFSCSDHNYLFKSKLTNIKNKYIYYYILKNIKILENGFKGTAIKNISKSFIHDIKIPIPSIEIQQKIVDILDNDSAIINNFNNLIEMYEKKKQNTVYVQTLNVEKKKLGELVNIKGGKRLPLNKTYSDNDTGYYYIQVSDLFYENNNFKSISKEIFDELINYKLSNNEIIISIAGTIGKIYKFISDKNTILTENACKLIINNKNNLYFNYLYYILNFNEIQKKFKDEMKTTTIPKLSLLNISNIEIPIPSTEIQTQIIAECESYDKFIKQANDEIKKIQESDIINKILNSLQSNTEAITEA